MFLPTLFYHIIEIAAKVDAVDIFAAGLATIGFCVQVPKQFEKTRYFQTDKFILVSQNISKISYLKLSYSTV